MAKTYNQIKNSVLGKNYDINSNVKREKEEKTYADIKSDVLAGKYNFSRVKSNLEREIGLGTLGSDITSLNKRLTESATGWQTQETMNGVRSSVESMQGRLKAFKEYERLFGEGDKDTFKDLRSSYTSAMENWDGLIESYGKYDNAETYTKETEALNALFSMSAEDVQAIIAEREDKVKELETMVKDYNKATGPLGKAYGYTYIGEDGKLYWGMSGGLGKLVRNIINGTTPTADNPIADNPIARENAKNSEEAYNRYLSGILGNEVEGIDAYSYHQTSGRLEGRNEDPIAEALTMSPEDAHAYINEYYPFKTPEKAEKKKGYASIEDVKKDLEEYKNPVAYTMADGTEITWQGLQRNLELKEMSSVGDVDSENWDKDYKKYVEKGRAMSEETEGGFLDKSYKNHIGYLRNHPEELEKYEIGMDSSGVMIQSILGNNTNYLAAKHMTKEEFNTYSYYLGKGDVEGAEKYLDLLGDSLRAREGKEIAWNTEGFWDSAHLAYRTGIDQFVQGTMNNFSDADYIPYSPTQQASGIVRQEISEEHGDFATGAYDLGVTGANMLPSVLVGTAVSMVAPQVGVPATAAKVGKALSTVASSATMFAGARGNAYQEMLNLGYSKEQASTYGNLVGASEVGLNALLGGISKLGTSVTSKSITKLVSQIDNGFARFAIRYPLNMASEGIEEGLQEVLTPTFKNIAAGYDTGEKVDWGNVMYSALLGGLLGGVFEAGPLAMEVSRETQFNNAMGKNIKANERVGDLFNFASQTSEESEAYKTYTQYAAKGINSENVSDYKLGNLYSQTRAEAEGIANSKKSTAEQKAQAKGIIKELDVYSQASPSARTGSAKNFDKKAVKNIYDKETVNALIESGLESAEGTEAYKLATEYKAKVEGGKNLSADEIAKLSDANDAAIRAEENASAVEDLVKRGESKDVAELVARKIRGEILTTEEATKVAESDVALQYVAEQSNAENVTEELLEMAKTMPKKDAALFVALYDGKTDMEAYANAFNLAVAKSENNFSQDDIFKSKSVLSNAQVAKIYEEVRVKADKDVEARFDKLVKATADKKFYKGSIDESVIDYDNKSTSGRVNWKDLDSRQKKAITFMNGFARATGINLVWIKDDEKANGKYDRASNTLYLDVYAGIDHADKLADTIIPTASHELTHWLEKKSPELFRKINNLVFSTLYEHDGRTEEKRIKDEMARTGKSEEVVRSEIIARACEEVLSLSEQGKKIFNSLSKSEQKTFVDKIKEIIQDIVDWVSEFLGLYGKDSLHYEARVLHQYQDKLAELVKLWDEALVGAVEVNQALEKSGLYGNMESIGSIDLKELAKAVGINGGSLFQYKAIVEDEAIYREMLLKHKDAIGITKADINALFDMIDKAVDIISKNVEALDFAWEADIDDRAFNPVKANSDKLYQVSLDFSTLCRKRLLQQTVQQTLQNALNKQLSKEESIAIRDELMKIQEEGRKIEVACALCYVEAARMKSPEQIKKFLNNREASIREFFANRSLGDIKAKIEEAEMKAREKLKADNPDGYYGKNDEKLDILTAPKSRMKSADAKFVRDEGKKVKASYEMTAHEQAELDAALKMTVTDFTSAKGLEKLAKNHPDLFDAYTSFVRNATHSKGIENDTWWRAGDSDSIGDSLIAKMNEENGLRSQSWSDFQVIHLLDYIAATIELSTKGAKRQSYTKVPDYVKLLGNTGDMINLSLIPERVFEGKLKYDAVEGMAYEIAKKLRDEYHATVGTVCIGINDEQIKMLLMDEFIDYVIPYHHSSMSKATRKLMHIPAWESYQNYQSEKKLEDTDARANAKKYGVTLNKDAKYQKAPNFSEWFDIEEARQIAKMENEHPSDMEAYKKYGKMYGGYKAMQNAANNYLKLCAERGLAPKFSMGTDFTQEANYWKLLIDRKMVDNVTGEVIEQKAIKPIFNEKHVLEILTDELERYPQVKADQEYAIRKVTEKFLSGEMKVDASTLEAIKKPIDNVTEVNILESSRDDADENVRNINLTENDLTEYMRTGKTLHTRNKKQRMLESGKKPIITSYVEFKDFISDVIKGKALGEVRAFKKVGKRLADAIYNKRNNLDLLGKYLELNADDIRESYKRHLSPKEKGDIPLSEQDFENIPDYLDNFDGVLGVNTYNNKIEVHLYKENKEGYVRILTVVSTERNSLQVTKLIGVSKEKFEQKYAKKIEGDIGSPRGLVKDSNPSTTARHTADVPSDNSILDSDRNVKENSSEKDSVLNSERDDVSIYDLMGENERIKKQNEKFKAEVENLRELLAIEKKVTNGNYIANSKALAAAEVILKRGNSNYDKVKLAKEIKGVYEYLAEAEGSKYDALFRKCYEMADNVLREAKEEKVVDDYFKGILKDIRTTRISLDEMQKQEAKHLFGDHWNRSFMGKVIIAEDGTSLDTMWQTWAGRYPEQFNADVNPNDQIGELYDIINTLQESSESVVEYDVEERRRWLAEEIFNTFWNIPTVETTADKYDKRIKELKAEHKKSIAKVREEYKSRMDSQMMADDVHFGRKISELKKSNAEALAEQKKADRERFKQMYANIRERKDAEVALAKEHGREMLSSYTERAEKKTKIQSITSVALTLNDWLVKNNKDKHIVEPLKGPVVELLSAIDFSSKSLIAKGELTKKDVSLLNALRHIEDKLGDMDEGDFTFYDLYGSELSEDIKLVIKDLESIKGVIGEGTFVLQDMSLQGLKKLDEVVRKMRSAVIKANKFHKVHHSAGIVDLAGDACVEMDKLGEMKYKGELGKTLSNLNWNNLTPYYAFRRYGDSAFKIFEAYMDGYDKIAFGQKAAIDFTKSLYTDKDVRKWEKTVYDFTITQRDGKERKFKMSLPQIMELYCAYKQDDVQEHFQSGITLTEIKKGKQAEVINNILLEEKHYLEIFSKLNEHPDAKKVADSMHEYMGRVGADLINEISMARWGIKSAGVTNYYPIRVSKGTVDKVGNTKEEKMAIQNELYSLINAGFTKNRKPGASQSVLIGNIFDTFATHMAEVITYNAMALPVLDALKWYNYRGKDGFGNEFGTQTSMLSAFGTEGTNYFTQLIKDINGVKKSMSDGIYNTLLRNYKIASVGASLKVAFLQPTAYAKAYAVLDAKYLVKGAKLTDLLTRRGSKRAQEHCGAALQKSMGYVDTHMSRGLANEIKHTKSVVEKAREISMWLASYADDYTFGCLWNACELETKDKHKDLKVGSDEYFKVVSDRMREVIYSTQVMDNTLTRSQIMRNPDGKAKELSMFMSEPTLGYNMVTDAFISYSLDKKRYGKDGAKARHKNRIARVLTGYTLTNALAAAIETAFSALLYGDDEEDENFVWKEFLKNFGMNMSLIGKITYFKDVVSIFEGFDTTRVETQGIVNFFEALGAWKNVIIDGKSTQSLKAVRETIQATSDLLGLPFYKVFQQTTNLFFSYEELKEMFGDFFD